VSTRLHSCPYPAEGGITTPQASLENLRFPAAAIDSVLLKADQLNSLLATKSGGGEDVMSAQGLGLWNGRQLDTGHTGELCRRDLRARTGHVCQQRV
jgi:hypothetical protein